MGSAEIYDPATGVWTTTGSLADPRVAFDLSVTSAGVVASGGAANNHGLESVEIFDASTGKWRAGPKLDGERLYHAAAVVNGKLVVAGGKIANVSPITSVDVLDDARWRSGASLKEARTGASFVSLQSGKGLLAAGNDQLGNRFLADAAIYDADADTWTAIELARGRALWPGHRSPPGRQRAGHRRSHVVGRHGHGRAEPLTRSSRRAWHRLARVAYAETRWVTGASVRHRSCTGSAVP